MAPYKHPNAVVLPPPVQVNAFIRFCRWGALGVGVLYGVWRLRHLNRKHAPIREREHQQIVEAREKHAKERAIMNRAEMLDLVKTVGMEVTPELEQQLGLNNPPKAH